MFDFWSSGIRVNLQGVFLHGSDSVSAAYNAQRVLDKGFNYFHSKLTSVPRNAFFLAYLSNTKTV